MKHGFTCLINKPYDGKQFPVGYASCPGVQQSFFQEGLRSEILVYVICRTPQHLAIFAHHSYEWLLLEVRQDLIVQQSFRRRLVHALEDCMPTVVDVLAKSSG